MYISSCKYSKIPKDTYLSTNSSINEKIYIHTYIYMYISSCKYSKIKNILAHPRVFVEWQNAGLKNMFSIPTPEKICFQYIQQKDCILSSYKSVKKAQLTHMK